MYTDTSVIISTLCEYRSWARFSQLKTFQNQFRDVLSGVFWILTFSYQTFFCFLFKNFISLGSSYIELCESAHIRRSFKKTEGFAKGFLNYDQQSPGCFLVFLYLVTKQFVLFIQISVDIQLSFTYAPQFEHILHSQLTHTHKFWILLATLCGEGECAVFKWNRRDFHLILFHTKKKQFPSTLQKTRTYDKISHTQHTHSWKKFIRHYAEKFQIFWSKFVNR